jgi:hypothetical protein
MKTLELNIFTFSTGIYDCINAKKWLWIFIYSHSMSEYCYYLLSSLPNTL